MKNECSPVSPALKSAYTETTSSVSLLSMGSLVIDSTATDEISKSFPDVPFMLFRTFALTPSKNFWRVSVSIFTSDEPKLSTLTAPPSNASISS